jgi:3D (Asp-Asp-Asp) domain-containing protein
MISKIFIKYITMLFMLFTLNFCAKKDLTATIYHAVPAQTNSDPEHTASMYRLDLNDPYKHRILAVSRDLQKAGYTFGTTVNVSCDCPYEGEWVVEDLMNKRYENRIDFLINEDMEQGKWENVEILKLN